MMPWILPNNSSSIVGMMQGVNAMLGNNTAFIMLIITIFVISFVAAMLRTEFEKALLFSSWMATMTAFFGAVIFQADASLIILPLVMTLIGAFLVKRHG